MFKLNSKPVEVVQCRWVDRSNETWLVCEDDQKVLAKVVRMSRQSHGDIAGRYEGSYAYSFVSDLNTVYTSDPYLTPQAARAAYIEHLQTRNKIQVEVV